MQSNTIRKYTNIREYLLEKGISFREINGELVIRCIFNDCDADSIDNEAHLYIDPETGLYHCKKCDAKGNHVTLMRHLGDDISHRQVIEKRVITPKAQEIWEAASEASPDFPYLKKKGVLPHGIRFRENKLVVPMYNSDGSISSIQFITADGDKRFLTGATTAKCFFLIGTPKERLCVAEGLATGASIFEATGYAVAVAFSSTNLKATAEETKKKFPNTDIIVCSDTDVNGLQKAREAASIGARLAIPRFKDGEVIDGKAPTDFNDLHVLQGHSAVKTIIDSAEIIREKFSFTSLASLLNEPEEETSWIVDELLPSSGFSIIAAKPKVGKSTLARQLAICVAQGGLFLDRKTTKGPVLYVALEEKRSEVKRHFMMLGGTGADDLHSYIGSAPEEASQWLTKEVRSKKPVLVIIDTLFRFARVTDVSDYAKVTAALDPLLTLARENAAHLMVIHHARKMGGDGGDSTLGSTAIFGTVDTSIILKKIDGKRTIETQQRYGVDMESTLLVFDETSKSVKLGGTKEEDDRQKISDEIINLLTAKGESMSESAINDEVGGRTALKRKALRDLFAKNQVKRSGGGKRNDPFLYSCSLVPDIYQGQEKQETKSPENPDSTTVIARSQDLPNLVQPEQKNDPPETKIGLDKDSIISN